MNTRSILDRKTTSLKCLLWMLLCGVSVLPLAGFQNPGSQQAQGEPRSFGGTFKTLQSPQQRLMVEWVRRFNSTANQNVDAEKAYDAARLSMRTTFDAVTHALMNTKLTSKDGRSLGTALDLIDILDDIAGRAGGTRRSPVSGIRLPETKCLKDAGREPGVQARTRQHPLSHGISHLLPASVGATLHSMLARARWQARRHRY